MAPRKTRTVRQQYFIRASPKKVFKAISRPDRIVEWFADEASLSARKGGRYSFTWRGGFAHSGKVLEFVREKVMTLAWEYADTPELGTTKLRFSIVAKGEGTLLTLTHSGFPRARWADVYEGAIWGWTYFMLNLKSVLESGHDLRSKHDG